MSYKIYIDKDETKPYKIDTYTEVSEFPTDAKNVYIEANASGTINNNDVLEKVIISENYNCNATLSGFKNVDKFIFPTSMTTFPSIFYKSDIETVIIPSSITSIGQYAFENCSSLTSIEIPSSVTSIGDEVFCGCSSLASIEIPNSVTAIGQRAFQECNLLSSIEIPSSVTAIAFCAFYNCSSLASIEIPNSVTYIGNNTFNDCSSLKSIEISSSITTIESNLFYRCYSLTSIVIPSSATSIGSIAFDGCISLTSITMKSVTPPTITSTSIFTKNTGLKIYLPSEEAYNNYIADTNWVTYKDYFVYS